MTALRRVRGALHAAVCGGALAAASMASAQAAPAADAPQTAPAEDAAAAVVEEQGELKFAVMEYVVRGNTVLTPAQIQTALMPHTGYDKRVKDVTDARGALEAVYRSKGYQTVVVDVPQQDVSSGIIELAVTEGRIGNVRVTGADYVLPSEVKGSIPSLTRGSVPNVPLLQEQLAQSNARTSRTITPEFRAGAAPGTVDVDLAVDDRRPWGGSVELNDQYNRSTERLRVSASANYDNLFQAGHSANVAFQFAPQDFSQVQVVSGSYYAPIGYSRTSVLGYVVNSNTDVATVGGLTVLGDGLTIGGRVIHTLANSPPGTVQSILLGVDYKDYLDQIGLTDPATGDVLTFDTPVTYLPFTAQYRWINVRDSSNSEFAIGTTFAFDGLVGDQLQFGGKPFDPFDPGSVPVPGKRDNAQASFLYFYGNASHQRRFKGGFDGKLAIDWQIATDPLISNEQFVLGGLASVRGYREAEVLGDSGVRGSLELGYAVPLGIKAIDWRVAAFVEGGYAWIERPLPEEASSFALGSAGLTTRFDLFDLINGQVDVAYQFDADPAKSGIPVDTDLEGLRVHFKIGVKY